MLGGGGEEEYDIVWIVYERQTGSLPFPWWGKGGMFKTSHNVQVLGTDIQFSVRFSQEWGPKCVRSSPKLLRTTGGRDLAKYAVYGLVRKSVDYIVG